ncbi:hypothetical protein L207DRAFT_530331 [Hyaloscypha variabilis F]|uniref:DUF7892 domain-containing protein n=1 Tax=Hyaloscypha variabilis (strain UAMH 11265 / GT02V1 / F) TaxID=1149755 RepID=A0A2J6RK10_HYAVF|nr:hypothetical protein L207DRAFT_530331 [Hyaloscypha variabilis F]
MESPDSDISPDADSSSADSTSADSSPTQALGDFQAVPAMEEISIIHNDDSASDVSMSTDSEDDDNDEVHLSTTSISAIPAIRDEALPASLDDVKLDTEASKKRKYSGLAETQNGEMSNSTIDEIRKRLKPDDGLQPHRTPEGYLRKDKSLLPPEIWSHIFTFCVPRVLGHLLPVNKAFHAYLDPSASGNSHEPLSRSALKILTPETIWRASRHLYLPGTPGPLAGRTELDMWKLACGTLCQFCGKKRQTNSTLPMVQWHPGPGENGVIPVWPFGILACGSCIQIRSTKEIDLLLSSAIPSPLMTALPFIFLTNELHVIPAATLQSGPPTGIQISKYFFKPHIEDLKQEFDDVKNMGSAAAEEWIKGLEGRGRERRNDALRWERWEASGGVGRMRDLGINGVQNPERQSSTHSLHATSLLPVATTNGHNSLYQGHTSTQQSKPFQPSHPSHLPLPPPPALSELPPLSTAQKAQHFDTDHENNLAPNPPPRFDSPSQNGFSSYPSRIQPRHERTKEEVAELKAARRAEIERRCMLLTPPITAAVLAHMASFQAAIQIIQPLGDGAWEVLKPRLLSQREEAEQRENDRIAQTRVVQERFDERRFQDMQAKSDSKDLVDREWDDIQAPLRARIGGYADEIIRDGWSNGEKVSHDTAPLFASEVLIYVRKRFYAEVAKDEAAVRATGREPELDPPNGPYTRKLILENMKWVFDTKVKPHTEPYRKELFLCNACEYPSKYYGFEGVIQHYAAKHTSALSVGSVVVHWKSEWPEYPPFHPDPNNISIAPYYTAAPNASTSYAGAGPSLQQNYGYGGYQTAPVSAPMSGPNPHVYQESPGPYYGHPQFGETYSAHQNGPYAPPPTYPDNSQGYQTPQYSVAPPPAPIHGYNDPSQDYSQQGFGGQYPQPMAQNMYTSPHPSTLYPASVPDVPVQQANYPPPGAQYGQSYSQQPAYPQNNFVQGPPPPQRTEEYMSQLQDIARNAREIWNSIGSLKDVPGALKVYTIIYHILQRFRTTFQEDPPLAMIVDGLSNNKDMRPVRNVNGLLCKACSLGMAGSSTASQKKRFSFPQLVNHFHSVHEQGLSQDTHGYMPDWTKDMVELPDMSDLRLTSTSPGMDENKLSLFTEALPELFAEPPLHMGDIGTGSTQHYEDLPDRNEFQGLAPSVDNHEKYYATIDSGRPSETGSVTYDSGEYDPRHPGDLPMEPHQQYKAPRRNRSSRQHERRGIDHPAYRHEPQQEETPRGVYDDLPERSYAEQRPISSQSRALPYADYERVVVREEPPLYMDRPLRFRDSGDVEYRVKREPRVLAYDEADPVPLARDYRLANSEAYQSNRQDVPSIVSREPEFRSIRLQPPEDVNIQQNRIFEVVAQISQQAQQAQQARERQPNKEEPLEAGSEDGEVRAEPRSKTENGRADQSDEASNAAERFLNEFRLGETADEAAKKRENAERQRDEDMRVRWEAERGERVVYQAPAEPLRRIRDEYEEDHRILANGGRLVNPGLEGGGSNGYIIRERIPAPRQSRVYAYEDQPTGIISEHAVPRERSPELVDRRYKLNNVVYRDERQSSHGTRRTPSRYARYESVRLENDRARSRSPVYVKMGAQPAQYRERTPIPALRQEPIYRTRTPPPAAEELAYERAPRQEYYRVYADEPRPREPQYAEAFEYVRVSDPQGDYMIRRPVRREPEPVYATYEDEVYTRQRAPASRPEVFEEYDPRHPEPPLQAPLRQVRYQ